VLGIYASRETVLFENDSCVVVLGLGWNERWNDLPMRIKMSGIVAPDFEHSSNSEVGAML